MLGQPFRIPPIGPPSAYRTFSVRTPRGPGVERPASCEEVACERWVQGWITRVPATDAMLNMVRSSKRAWLSMEQIDGQWVFTFAPGTECFESGRGMDRLPVDNVRVHRILIRPDLPQALIVSEGDWRGNPRGTPPRRHQRPEDWVEDLQENLDGVRDRLEKG